MNNLAAVSDYDALFRRLADLLGEVNVSVDIVEREFFSSDVYRPSAHTSAVVVSPGTPEEVATAAAICTEAGLSLFPRGGGLSYTGGYLPTTDASAMFDLRRLNRIIEINTTDMYVTVEAGCVWKDLYEQLKAMGVRTPYFGPMSGYSSTVGGALSQGSVFLGSTQYGSTAETTLGLEVVLANGSRIKTGSAASIKNASPFFRTYGPDLTGAFLGDAGSLGIKVSATLRLISLPKYQGYASFSLSNYQTQMTAMSEISRRGLAAECFGSDPYISNARLWDDDAIRDMNVLAGIARSGRTALSGLADAARVAIKGRKALKDIAYSLHVTVDDHTAEGVDAKLREVRSIVGSSGVEMEPTIPRATRGCPFVYPNQILGPNGHRWVTSNAVVPHSRAQDLAAAVLAYFRDHQSILSQHGIEWGFVIFAISTNAILFEPMLYWPDEAQAYHKRVIEPGYFSKLIKHQANPAARTAVYAIRSELIDLFTEFGCAHLQIGKLYRYSDSRQPELLGLLSAIKRHVDPDFRMNPGALGIATRP